jgi:hypothetical protein
VFVMVRLPSLAMLEPVEDVQQPDEVVPVAAEASPLQFLCAVYRNAGLPLATRIRASIAAAQYCHPKISVICFAG